MRVAWAAAAALGVLVCAAAQTPPAKKPAAPKAAAKPAPVLEPRALEILKASSDKLAAAGRMSFTAEVTYESLSRHGQALAYLTTSDVAMQRPDKLRVITPGDGPATEFYYNGKQMMAYVPAEDLLAVADAPPTIDAALEAAYNSAAIYFPFTDVIVADPYKDIADDLQLAYYIGQSSVAGGVVTDMVGYISHGVFVQAWIGAQDKLPRMMRAIYIDDPNQLRHSLRMSNWKLDDAVAAVEFVPAKAATAKRIPFGQTTSQPPSAKPAGKAKPASPKSTAPKP